MSNERSAPNPYPPVSQKRKPSEVLWTLKKGAGTVECRVLGHAEFGEEVQLFGDGGFFAGRRFNLRAQAIAHGNELKANLKANGWSEVKGAARDGRVHQYGRRRAAARP